MKRHATSLVAVLMLLVGCATGAAVSSLVVPAVRAGTNPTRWEYVCRVASRRGIEAISNPLGKAGWEMATSGGDQNSPAWCFKRPLP